MKHFVRPLTHLTMMPTGYGNGYVIIPEGHPFHGAGYDDIPVDVHGGLTFAESAQDCDWLEIEEEDKKGWVVGFDTAHYLDTLTRWPRQAVEEETIRLRDQLIALS